MSWEAFVVGAWMILEIGIAWEAHGKIRKEPKYSAWGTVSTLIIWLALLASGGFFN